MIEFKIFLFWVFICVYFGAFSIMEHQIFAPDVKYRRYEGFITSIFKLMVMFTFIIIIMWLFLQVSSALFTGHLFLISNL
jgi:hypothetical protein